MRITFIGPDAYRQIPTAGDIIVQRGETVDLDDEVARSLLDQSDQWARTKPVKDKE